MKYTMAILASTLSFAFVASIHLRMQILPLRDSFEGNAPVWSVLVIVFAMLGYRVFISSGRRVMLYATLFAAILASFEVVGYSLFLYGSFSGLNETVPQILKSGLKWVGTAYLSFICFSFVAQWSHKRIESAMILRNSNSTYSPCFLVSRTWLFWPGLLLCWLPYFIHWYPGILMWDSFNEIQMLLSDELTRYFPVLHLVFLKLSLGSVSATLADVTTGAAVYTAVQMILFSGLITYALHKLARWGFPRLLFLGVFVYFAFVPVNAVFAITMWKDTLFSGFVLLYTVCLVDFALTRGESVKTRLGVVCMILSVVGMVGFRPNGLHLFILSMPFVILFFPFERKRLGCVAVTSLLASLVLVQVLTAGLGAYDKGGFIGSVTIPVQQAARIVTKHEGELSSADRTFLEHVFVDKAERGGDILENVAENYNPILVDPMYHWLDEDWIEANKGTFVFGWLRLALHYPKDALTATLVNGYGYWWPEIYYPGGDFTGGSWEAGQIFGVVADGYDGDSIMTRTADMNALLTGMMATPFGIFFRVSLPTILCLFLAVLAFYQKRRRDLILLLPIFVLLLTCLAGPLNAEYRYYYGAFCALPILAVYYFRNTRAHEKADNARYYDHIIPVGANCEVAFQYQRHDGNVESSLFAWGGVQRLEGLIGAIEDPGIVFSGKVTEFGDHINMWECEATGLYFHGVSDPQDILGDDGNYLPEKEAKEIADTRSRIRHLADKLKAVWASEESQLYVMTVNYRRKGQWISKDDAIRVYGILKSKNANAELLIVTNADMWDEFKFLDNGSDLFVRYVLTFTSWSKVTADGYFDAQGWDKICSEFRPKKIGARTKSYKFEKDG